MNKLKMAAVQERLKLKRVQIDTWTTREKLCLASAVLRSGDQNWVSVSRTLRAFDELNRPPDWFSQKNCALQYSSLLEKVDTPKRKRGERGEVHVETPGESIVRKLTSERVEELKKSIEIKRMLHNKLKDEIALVMSGQADDKLDEMLQEIEEEKRQKQREAEQHAQWLKEREEKLLEIRRAWKPPATASASATASSPSLQRDPEIGTRQSSSQSEQSSEAESLVDSPLSEPLQVDVIGDESLEGQVEVKPSSPVRESSPQPNSTPAASSAPATPTPTSPLLTSLLKSPSQAPSLQASSILHSAITAQRGSSPTITSLLNSSPAVPVSGSGAISPSKSVAVKILGSATILSPEGHSEKNQSNQTSSSTSGTSTLSMLLGLPPTLSGNPLPELPDLSPHKPTAVKGGNISHSLAPSPPSSPQSHQIKIESDPPVIDKEGELEEERPTKRDDSMNEVETIEVKPEIDKTPKENDDSLVEQSEKSNVSTIAEDKEKTVEIKEEPVSPEEELEDQSDLTSLNKPKERKDLDISEIKSGTVENAINTDNGGKAAEIEPTSDKKSLTDVPQTVSPEHVEAPKMSVSEDKSEEKIQEKPTTEKESSLAETENDVENEGLPQKETSEIPENSSVAVVSEETSEISESVTETSSDDVVEKKADAETLDNVVDEREVIVKEDVKQPQVLKIKEADEPSTPEVTSTRRKSEATAESANEEESINDKGPVTDSPLSGTESLTPDSQLRRRGGVRGRRFRGRALTLYRLRQEKIAKERLEKDKDDFNKAMNSGAEDSSKETTVASTIESEDSAEKTEVRKENVVGDEIKNLMSEWDEDSADNASEDSKKMKSKKIDVANEGEKQKAGDLKKSESESTAEIGEENETSRKEGKMVDDEPFSATIKTKEDEKAHAEPDEIKDKKSESNPGEDEPTRRNSEAKHEEHEDTDAGDRTSEDRRVGERRPSDKKSDIKVKAVYSEKKIDEKERKKLRESKGERKEKKDESERKVEEQSPKDEEGSSEKVAKEKKIEAKDRKSTERHIESVDKRQLKDKKMEEKEDRSIGERRLSEKGSRDGDAKKIEGERKLSRDKKSEERERKGLPEKKTEDGRKRATEEKQEESRRSRSIEKEVISSSKKSLHPAEKSRTPSTTAASELVGEKSKRKYEAVDEDSSPADRAGPEVKQAKRSEEASESDKETNEVEKKAEEDSLSKRKMDRRKMALIRRLDMEETSNKGASTPADDKEKAEEHDSTPKSNIGRRRGPGSTSVTSTPGVSVDQVPHSPASSQSLTEEERDYRAWKKAILLVWNRLATHKYASIFLRPITNEQAPGYHNVVFRPIDLHTIKKNVENGIIRTTTHFQRDVMLMFLNAIMYNSSDHDVHRMSLKMQEECLQHIQILLEASEAPKVLRRETREGNKRLDSSSQMHYTPSSHDEASTGATPSASSSQNQAAEIIPFITSEDEMSESECQLSYLVSRQKMDDSGDFSGATPSRFHKGSYSTLKRKRNEEDSFLELSKSHDVVDGGSSAEDSNSSDNEYEKTGTAISTNESQCIPKIENTKSEKEGKSSSSAHFANSPEPELGEEQLSCSQFGDHDNDADESEKKQMRRMKRSMTECLISSEDSCSIPDDGGFWPNVMSIKGEKADDTESVTSSIYKRRRVQRKSTNSDPDSLSEAPSFMFSPNSASLEESDYQAWKRLVLHTWDQLADHRYATIFMTPVRTDEAPRYYHVVYRPMDLGSIRKNVEKGVVRSISHFQRDILLMFTNALMYNPSHHDVHLKTAVMQKECLQYLQVLVQESAEDPEVFRHEIRESNNKIHSTGLDDVVFAPKSDSLSSEDQLSCSLMTGEASSTPQHNTTAEGMG